MFLMDRLMANELSQTSYGLRSETHDESRDEVGRHPQSKSSRTPVSLSASLEIFFHMAETADWIDSGE